MTIALVFIINIGHSQTAPNDIINQRNTAEKKVGLWVQYLDSLIKPTTLNKAKFFRYVTYNDDEIRKSFISGFSKKYVLTYYDNRPSNKNNLPLNRAYTFEKKFKTISGKKRIEKTEETYNNRHPIIFKQYFDG